MLCTVLYEIANGSLGLRFYQIIFRDHKGKYELISFSVLVNLLMKILFFAGDAVTEVFVNTSISPQPGQPSRQKRDTSNVITVDEPIQVDPNFIPPVNNLCLKMA